MDDDADGATPSTNPKPTPASKCAPPNPKQLVKHGWRYNAWRYFPAPIDAATDPVYYSVGVGRDITFEAIDIMRVRDGKITDHWGVTDIGALMRQISAR